MLKTALASGTGHWTYLLSGLLSLWVALVTNAESLSGYLKKPSHWFESEQARQIAANVISHQGKWGSWPKNTNTHGKPYTGDPARIQGTFDNGATVEELRFLARMGAGPAYRQAFEKGLDGILSAQYANGGWPQFYPSGKGYHRYITFNDNTMVRLMLFLREVADVDTYAFLGAEKRRQAKQAFDKGIGCILKCQVVVNGRRTVWCAQHDETTLEPRPARIYEHASLSGAESVRILELLMSVKQPGPDILRAIEDGCAWFEQVKIKGMRQIIVVDENGLRDKKIVGDAKAGPLWARFYEIPSMKPIFSGRDGVRKYQLAEIEPERRNGYGWYGNWGEGLLTRDLPRWRATLSNSGMR